jgi:hypothetical protein
MSMSGDLEILERAAEARGRLLRVEADRAGAAPRVLVLTFEVGRILLTAGDEGLSVAHMEERSGLPGELSSLDEEEPWWRVLGQPITAAWPGGVEAGIGASGLGSLMVVKLRFREEGDNPRVVVLEATGSAVRVSLES